MCLNFLIIILNIYQRLKNIKNDLKDYYEYIIFVKSLGLELNKYKFGSVMDKITKYLKSTNIYEKIQNYNVDNNYSVIHLASDIKNKKKIEFLLI